MKRSLYLLVVVLVGCGGPSQRQQKVYANPEAIAESIAKNAGPDYESIYSPEEVTLEVVSDLDSLDQLAAVEVLVNSCAEVKADYLNYLMDVYATIEPTEDELEPLFDGEHLGKFIVWKYVKQETGCFEDFFNAMKIVFEKGDQDAIVLAKYSVFDMMIMESRKLDVNYNTAFEPYLNEVVLKRFMDYLWHEKESGRS